MAHGLSTILQVVIGSSVGAGVVTFVLNLWKAQMEFRRAKLEELYAAKHRFARLTFRQASETLTVESLKDEELGLMQADLDRLFLLVNLYFPQLRRAFEAFSRKATAIMLNPFLTRKELALVEGWTKDVSAFGEEVKKFDKAVLDLAHRKPFRAFRFY
jgi:hypothetical protein